MISFIIFTVLLLFVAFRSFLYLFRSFSPFCFMIFITSFVLLCAGAEAHFAFIPGLELSNRIPLLATFEFYWFTSILLLLGIIILRDLHRNLYFEKLTTDLVRTLAISEAKEL